MLPSPTPRDKVRIEGRIIEHSRWDLCTLFDVNYQPRLLTPQRLREGMYWLTENFTTPSASRFAATHSSKTCARKKFQGRARRRDEYQKNVPGPRHLEKS